MAFWIVVLRPFTGEGRTFGVDEIVDAESWRTRDALTRQRRIRPATAQEVATAEEVEVVVPVTPPPLAARKRSRK